MFAAFLEVFLVGKKEERQRWMVMLWCIWIARNRKSFDGKFTHPSEVKDEAGALLKEFLVYRDCVSVPV